MEVEQVLHMNGGMEDTSYAMSSMFQRKAIAKTQPITEEAITGLISNSKYFSRRNNNKHSTHLGIADLGCASGPNTLLTVLQLIKAAEKIFLNDLPGNDFNNIFSSLQGFRDKLKEEIMGTWQLGDDHHYSKADPNGHSELLVFFNGVPGSFYGRLFPANSLHFVHSSYSLQWLSRVPQGLEQSNKGNIYIASSSPSGVLKAYSTQFEKDFSLFLRCRAQEVVGGGRMVLTLAGRDSDNPSIQHACYLWELLSMVLNEMASEGLIDHEKLDSFNIPFYVPSAKEVEVQVQQEGSFTIERLETWESNWCIYDVDQVNLPKALYDCGYNVAKCMRAVTESMLVHQLLLPAGDLIDEVFRRYNLIFMERMTKEKNYYVNVTMSLIRQ